MLRVFAPLVASIALVALYLTRTVGLFRQHPRRVPPTGGLEEILSSDPDPALMAGTHHEWRCMSVRSPSPATTSRSEPVSAIGGLHEPGPLQPLVRSVRSDQRLTDFDRTIHWPSATRSGRWSWPSSDPSVLPSHSFFCASRRPHLASGRGANFQMQSAHSPSEPCLS